MSSVFSWVWGIGVPLWEIKVIVVECANKSVSGGTLGNGFKRVENWSDG